MSPIYLKGPVSSVNYIDQLESSSSSLPSSFLDKLNCAIQNELRYQKRSPPTQKGKVLISKNLYKYFESEKIPKRILKKHTKSDSCFLTDNHISLRSYFPAKGFNQIIESSFRIRIGKKKAKKFYDRPDIVSFSKEEFFFHFKFQKQFILDRFI